MTLVELLVSMGIFSLCMSVVFGAVILVVRKAGEVQESADAVSELRLALAQIDRQVRSGNVLFSPAAESTTGCTGNATENSGTCMRIFTQANGPEKCVQWQVTADPSDSTSQVLRVRSWDADWDTTGVQSDWRIVARGLRVGATNPFKLQGATSAYRERLLDVTLEVYDARRNTTVEVKSSLSGRNASYGYNAGQCTPIPPA